MRPRRRIFYGWWVVLASSAIGFFSGGMTYYALSAYFDSIVAEFGWKRAVISGAYSLRSLESGILTPLTGVLLDRVGPRILFLLGVTLCSLGLLILGSTNSILTLYVAFTVISVGGSACGITTVISATAKWFVRQKGKALALATAGGGASGLLVTVVAWLITAVGWRQALYISAAAIFLICAPLSLVVRHRPEDHGLLPDGEIAGGSPSGPAASSDGEFTSKQALQTSSFWLIALAMGVHLMGVHAVIVHLMPFLTNTGFPAQFAAIVMTLTVVLSLAGRFLFGWFADTHDVRILLAASFVLTVVGLVTLAFTRSTWQIGLFLLTFGVGYASRAPLGGAIQGEYFGRRSFGAIQGLSHSLATLFGVAGPVLTGWLFDYKGSYQLAFLIMAGVVLLSIPLILAVKRPQRQATRLTRSPTGPKFP